MHRLSTPALVGIVVFAGTVFAWTLVHALWYAPDSELLVPSATSVVVASSSPPMRLQIPALNIDATVQHVGINAKGNMGVPNNFTDVGWYKYGTTPGQLGSAVVDGHVSNGLSLPGVFKNLHEIKKGDDVYVVAADGSSMHFVVTDIQVYSYRDAPTDLIFKRSDRVRLNLITCDGSWLVADKTYTNRLVVYTELRIP